MIGKIKISGCNLNCEYCPSKNRGGESNDPEKMKAFIDALVVNGITELKWSGGEPTIYPEFLNLVKHAASLGLYQSVSTNGTYAPSFAIDMYNAGISRLNISLDTLMQYRYIKITGKDLLHRVLENIEIASVLFVEPTKINVVVTDESIDEVSDIYNRFKYTPTIIPRFLQLTYKGNDQYTNDHRMDTVLVSDLLPKGKKIDVSGRTYTNGVAEYFKYDGSVFSIIPQNHNCKSTDCMKLWYEDGQIFNCKIAKERTIVKLASLQSDMKHLIDSQCFKKTREHRVQS